MAGANPFEPFPRNLGFGCIWRQLQNTLPRFFGPVDILFAERTDDTDIQQSL